MDIKKGTYRLTFLDGTSVEVKIVQFFTSTTGIPLEFIDEDDIHYTYHGIAAYERLGDYYSYY